MEHLGKLELKQSGLFVIEVNDNGDTIVIDREDPNYLLKFQKMYEDVEKLEKEYKLKSKVIEKKEEKSLGLITNKDVDNVKLYNETMKKMRSIIDGVLGKNACQKIFGDRNYFGMLDDLLEALSPFLEKIGILNKDTKEAVIEKYSKKDDDTI